ncbi:MAG TPA: tetratricopeptide repeat protein [Burkholderiaceae bacterium]|nr:tetratricopeptide repeat protein [Burkholderiaceae bacterium]
MTGFVIVAGLLALLASLFFVLPLWRVNVGHPVSATATSAAQASTPLRGQALAFGAVFLLAAGALYAWVGEPSAITHPGAAPTPTAPAGLSAQQAVGSMTPEQIEGMVARLATRLQNQPEDPAGWRMLAKSYETLGRFPQAVDAYQRLFALQPPDADLLTDYAVVLGMATGRTLVGEPEAWLNEALKLDPTHVQALALSGSAAFERHDYAHAVAQWQRLLSQTVVDDATRASIEGQIARAQSLAQQPPQPLASGAPQ